MRLIVSPSAKQDLDDIGDFIARRDPSQAVYVIREIDMRCRQLADAPLRFPVATRVVGLALRVRAYGRYAIYYRIRDDGVEIVRVLHSARNADAIFGSDQD